MIRQTRKTESPPRQQVAKAEVDLTPMVDVTFLLLVFFVVTASIVMTAG